MDWFWEWLSVWRCFHENLISAMQMSPIFHITCRLRNKHCKHGFLTVKIPIEKTRLLLVWLKSYCHAERTLICSSHRDDWGIIVHLSIQTRSWCCQSLPVTVDYTWVSRSVKIQMSHVRLGCFCVSFLKVKQVAVLCNETDNIYTLILSAAWKLSGSAIWTHSRINRF